jgi:hypothetical protein
MFIFDGKPLSPDVAFTDPATGVQYPANWLRLSTLEEKEAIGITEVLTPQPGINAFIGVQICPKTTPNWWSSG